MHSININEENMAPVDVYYGPEWVENVYTQKNCPIILEEYKTLLVA